MNHFDIGEFECPDCGKADMNEGFLMRIDKARGIAKIPFTITSGYRCEKHNKDVGGSPTSSHLKGMAADIACDTSWERFKMIEALILVGFVRIGIADDFIHADSDMTKDLDVIWLY